MPVGDLWTGAGILVAVQGAALAWRFQREREVEALGAPTWFPVADWANAIGLTLCVTGAFILPALGAAEVWTLHLMALDGLVVAFYPFAVAAHYEMLVPRRPRPRKWFPIQERIVVASLLVCMTGYSILALCRAGA